MIFFAISLQRCLPGLGEVENNRFPKTLTISFLVLSVMHLFLIDCITSGLQLSGISIDSTDIMGCTVGIDGEELLLDVSIPAGTRESSLPLGVLLVGKRL